MFGSNKRRKSLYEEDHEFDDSYEAYEEYEDYDDYDESEEYEDDYEDEEYEEDYANQYETREMHYEPREARRAPQRPAEAPIRRETPSIPHAAAPTPAPVVEPAHNFFEEENRRLEYELRHTKESNQRLLEQLDVKQNEIARLMNLVNEKEHGTAATIQALEKKAAIADQRVADVKEQQERSLESYKTRIEELEGQLRQQDHLKSDLANIIIETKEQGRDIVERAQWEADRIKERAEIDARKIVSEASVELRIVKQEATQYCDRLAALKEESNILFDKLLTSSEKLVKQEMRAEKG